MRSGSISAPPKVCVFIASNLNAQFVTGITDPSVEGKLEGIKQGLMMDFNNNPWDALSGILTVVFGFIKISSSASVFFKSTRGSIIIYVAMLGLLRPLTVLAGQASFFQSCKRGNIKIFCFSDMPNAAFLLFASNKAFRRMAGLDSLAFGESHREDLLNNNVAEYVIRGKCHSHYFYTRSH